MQIHRFRGRNLEDALIRARDAHGEEALVVAHETAASGEVTVAVAEAAPPRAAPGAAGRAGRAPRPALDPALDPGLTDVRRRLERTGTSAALIARISKSVLKSGARGAFAIDQAARAAGRAFQTAPSPKLGRAAHVIAFVGPTGVGKTTTLIKLAGRLARAGRRVALVTTDAERPGGVAPLEACAESLEVPLEVARNARELVAAVARRRGREALLFDTAGRSPFDANNLAGLERLLGRTSERSTLDAYLVLSAAAAVNALEAAVRGFAACRPSACVLTKLDETDTPMPAVESSAFAELPVAFLCDGPGLAGHLHRPRADHFADLALRGGLR